MWSRLPRRRVKARPSSCALRGTASRRRRTCVRDRPCRSLAPAMLPAAGGYLVLSGVLANTRCLPSAAADPSHSAQCRTRCAATARPDPPTAESDGIGAPIRRTNRSRSCRHPKGLSPFGVAVRRRSTASGACLYRRRAALRRTRRCHKHRHVSLRVAAATMRACTHTHTNARACTHARRTPVLYQFRAAAVP